MSNHEEQQIQETNSEYQNRMIDEIRKKAYADPLEGSDRLFAEANRLKIMGEPHQAKEAEAVARYEEIKSLYPWPKE